MTHSWLIWSIHMYLWHFWHEFLILCPCSSRLRYFAISTSKKENWTLKSKRENRLTREVAQVSLSSIEYNSKKTVVGISQRILSLQKNDLKFNFMGFDPFPERGVWGKKGWIHSKYDTLCACSWVKSIFNSVKHYLICKKKYVWNKSVKVTLLNLQ